MTGAPQRFDALRGKTLLICVGAAKCATSWIHAYLDSLPEVAVSPLKEVHFFDAKFPRYALGDPEDLALKRLQFHLTQGGDGAANLRGRPSFQASLDRVQMIHEDSAYFGHFARICGAETRSVADITPAYAVIGRAGFDYVKSFCRAQDITVKVLFVMRDPVARLWSQFRHMAQIVPDKVSLAAWQAALDNPRVMARADYRSIVGDLDAVFPAKDLGYLFYEDLFHEDGLRQLCALSQAAYRPAKTELRVNETTVKHPLPDTARAAFRAALDPQYVFCRDRFGARVPPSWMA